MIHPANRNDDAGRDPVESVSSPSRLTRTLLGAAIGALLAMSIVPYVKPVEHGRRHIIERGYLPIYEVGGAANVNVAQLVLNVVFAALLGAIVATITPQIMIGVRKLPSRARTGILVVALLVAGGVAWQNLMEAAVARARRQENYAEELVGWQIASEAMNHFRKAATNWRLALHFGEATRVENRIRELQQHPPPEVRKAKRLTAEEFLDLPDQEFKSEVRGAKPAAKPSPSP